MTHFPSVSTINGHPIKLYCPSFFIVYYLSAIRKQAAVITGAGKYRQNGLKYYRIISGFAKFTKSIIEFRRISISASSIPVYNLSKLSCSKKKKRSRNILR